jgi:Protein of unknown function (DUF1688)
MGLFKRKTSKLSSYDEKVSGSQHSRSHLVANLSPVSINRNQPNSKPSLVSPTMSVPSIPIPSPPDPGLDPAAYLRSIHAVRERSKLVMRAAKSNGLSHFDVNMDMFQNTADYVVSIIKVCTTSTSCNCSRRLTQDLLLAGLCGQLPVNTASWAMAALRCWRTSAG